MKIISGVQCPDCQKRMFSFHVHDYKTCGCPNESMVDGGEEYLRRGGHKMPDIIEWDNEIDGQYPNPKVKYKDKFPY